MKEKEDSVEDRILAMNRRVQAKKDAEAAEKNRADLLVSLRSAVVRSLDNKVTEAKLMGLPFKKDLRRGSGFDVWRLYEGVTGNVLVEFKSRIDENATRAWLEHDDTEVDLETALAIIVTHLERELDA